MGQATSQPLEAMPTFGPLVFLGDGQELGGPGGSGGQGAPGGSGGAGGVNSGVCPCMGEPCLSGDESSSSSGSGFSAFPIRYANGEILLREQDLASHGFGLPWGHTRSYSNQVTHLAEGDNGNGWFVSEWPHLVASNGGATLCLISDIYSALWFDLTGGTWVAKFFERGQLVEDSGLHEFRYTDSRGRVITFYDFDVTPEAKRGQMKSIQDAYGHEYTPVYTDDGQIQELVFEAGDNPTGYYYHYYETGPNAGRLQYVRLHVKGQDVRRCAYEYYDGAGAHGSAGDLQRVVQQSWQNAQWADLGCRYYRYYTGEQAHLLKYVLSPQSYARMVSQGIDPVSATDGQLARHADHYFEADDDGRVTQENVAGGSMDYSFERTARPSPPSGVNEWTTRTEETQPDGTVNLVYTNAAAQPILKVFKRSAGSSQQWCEYFVYGANGRLEQYAGPDAVAGYTENVDHSLTVTLKPADGLIRLWEFYTTTNSATGAVAGLMFQEKIKKGSSGTLIPLREWKYTSRQVGSGVTIYPCSHAIAYFCESSPSTDVATTEYEYTWHTDTYQVASRTILPPIVDTAHHGTGNQAQRVEGYSAYGLLTALTDELNIETHTTYDLPTGGITQIVRDAGTGGLQLTSDYILDGLGRTLRELGPAHTVAVAGVATGLRRARWTVYKDAAREVVEGFGFVTVGESSSEGLISPVQLRRMDHAGRVTDEITATKTDLDPGHLAEALPQSDWVRWTHNAYQSSVNLLFQRVYKAIPSSGEGTEGTHYDQTNYGYDTMQRQVKARSPGGTITRTVYDRRGRPIETWVGTNDNGASPSDPTGGGAQFNNMVRIESRQYDNGLAGGSGNLTRLTRYPASGASRITNYTYDWRNRLYSVIAPENFYEKYGYCNLDTLVTTGRYESDGTTLIWEKREPLDLRGQVYKRELAVQEDATETVLTDNFWHDNAGNLIKAQNAGSQLFEKRVYDGAGRLTRRYQAYALSSDANEDTEAGSVADDVVMQQEEMTYDAASNLILQLTRHRFHDASDSQLGALQDPANAPRARVYCKALYQDALGRQIAVADYGTNGGTPLTAATRSATIPTVSDTLLVSRTVYNNRGEVEETEDAKGQKTRQTFDAAGRPTEKIENYVQNGTGADQNRTTQFAYTPDGKLLTLTALNAATGTQVTRFVYGTTLGDSLVARSDLLRAKVYPDSDDAANPLGDGSDEVYDRVEFGYNQLGELVYKKDQNGTIHEYAFDGLGRLLTDIVPTLGSGVDGAVVRIGYTYEKHGQLEKITSCRDTSPNSVVNEIKRVYNAFGQLTHEYQEHAGEVSGSLCAAYSYANGSANTIRPVSVTYPNGRVVSLDYGSTGGRDDVLSRIKALKESTNTRCAYTYLGLGQWVEADDAEPQAKLTYIKQSGEADGDAGDQYTGLDRFGRIVDQRWLSTYEDYTPERIKYGYDRAHNRLWRENVVANSYSPSKKQDEYYNYDELYQVSQLQRGVLNSGHTDITGTPTWQEDFTFDPMGNWHGSANGYVTRTNGTVVLNQNRSHNPVNEITDITESAGPVWETPDHDLAGNMVAIPQPNAPTTAYQLVWDAWHRLVAVYDGETAVAQYAYDGLSRRIEKTIGATARHYYYSAQWQVLEERMAGANNPERQFVWGLRGLDDLLLRDRDTDADGTLNERLYALADAMSVTAVMNTSGTVQERYGYNAFGQVRFMDADFGTAASAFAWETLFHGYRWDAETGLAQVRYRYLHPGLGRWLSRDPINEPGSKLHRGEHPKYRVDGEIIDDMRLDEEKNLYHFVFNNPISRYDYLGLGHNFGRCCNKSSGNEWALLDGLWRMLKPGQCTGILEDCDGMTCGGGFYYVSAAEWVSCVTLGCDAPPFHNRRWTPGDSDSGARPPGGPGGRGSTQGNTPPGYNYGSRPPCACTKPGFGTVHNP